MAEGTVRFEIGFTGGGATSGQAEPSAVKALADALERGADGVLPLDSEGTRLLVRVSEIAWIRIHVAGKRVGF